MRPFAPLALAALVAAAPLTASSQQTPQRGGDRGARVVRLAKWALLGSAVAFGAYALSSSRAAERSYDDLRSLCQRAPEACRLEGGRYSNAAAERLYRWSVDADHRARVGIYGGQITLLGSAGLFIYDLRNSRGPSDIPYPSGRRDQAALPAPGGAWAPPGAGAAPR